MCRYHDVALGCGPPSTCTWRIYICACSDVYMYVCCLCVCIPIHVYMYVHIHIYIQKYTLMIMHCSYEYRNILMIQHDAVHREFALGVSVRTCSICTYIHISIYIRICAYVFFLASVRKRVRESVCEWGVALLIEHAVIEHVCNDVICTRLREYMCICVHVSRKYVCVKTCIVPLLLVCVYTCVCAYEFKIPLLFEHGVHEYDVATTCVYVDQCVYM